MRLKISFTLLILSLILSACASGTATISTPQPTPSASTPSVLPTAGVAVTSVPDPRLTATTFLTDWQAEKFSDMYDMLTGVGQDAITRDKFVQRFIDISVNLTLQKVDFEILQSITNPTSAQVAYRLTFKTAILGDLARDNITMNLSLEKKTWKVQWDDGLIMPELKGGNKLQIEYKVPSRGDIYDRTGNVIAATADAVALGIIPGQIVDNQESALVSLLSTLTGQTTQAIRALYANAGPDWYIPVGEASAQDANDHGDLITALNGHGLVVTPFRSRYYFDGGVGPHVIGYVQPIFKEDLIHYQRLGYSGSEKVGKAGLEKWAENALAGQRGATLRVISPSGQTVAILAQRDSQPAQMIYTTQDKQLQLLAQKAIIGFTGAIVVMERDTGRILAMVSSPDYDPNLFEPTNYNNGKGLPAMLSDPNTPLINRATQGLYPLGSVFKIVMMSAALESGLYTADTTYQCGSYFRELPGVTLKDWTVDHGQPPSGLLTLPQGLMRSCDPFFYHIGLDLYRQKGDQFVSNIARGFGLGKPTGVDQIAEDGGNMPDPVNEDDSVQESIGQGRILVTPLQVASFVAAVGNGGTLFRPQVVEKITSPDGVPSFTFAPIVNSKLPVSQENLKLVQDAMRSVVADKRGTAWNVFLGMDIPIYGKTGTAQNPHGDAHAWFAGYTNAGRTDKPDIAVAVLVENAGEGSEIAAPIFRRVIEDYFFGRPSALYWWESGYYVKKTPQPTATPQP
jgi:penicillin-binding protein 2